MLERKPWIRCGLAVDHELDATHLHVVTDARCDEHALSLLDPGNVEGRSETDLRRHSSGVEGQIVDDLNPALLGLFSLYSTLYKCFSLDSSMGIAFSGSFAELCGGSENSHLRTREESCPVKHIYKFPSREDALATDEMAQARREAMAQFPEQQ